MVKPVGELINLTGKTAAVTGGAAGIGRGIVNRLHEAGANVLIADLDEVTAKAAADELNKLRASSAKAMHADVAQPQEANLIVQTAVASFGGLDIFVNNAGIFPARPLAEMNDEDFMKVISVNLRGAFLCTKAASEQMIKQNRGGKIINITSIDALHPSMVGLAHYDASKHGLWGFTKNAALELAQHKIWVNAIAPGGISTPGVARMQQPGTSANQSEAIKAFTAKIPMGRMGEPDDIGKVALFLASGLSDYICGTQIVVDGGALLD